MAANRPDTMLRVLEGRSENISLRILWRALRLVLGWKLRGKGWPHPLFDRGAKTPSRPITTRSASEREALAAVWSPGAPSPDARAWARSRGESPHAPR